MGRTQRICTPSSLKNKWQRVLQGDGVDGDHPGRPGSGTARHTLDFVLVASCHVSLIFICLPGGRFRWPAGVLWELERVTTPTESAVPNDYWSTGREKKRDIMFTRRAMRCTMRGHQKRGKRGLRALKRHAGNVSTGRRRSGPKAPTNHEGWSSHSTTSRNRKRSSVTIDPHRKLAIQECRGPHTRGMPCR